MNSHPTLQDKSKMESKGSEIELNLLDVIAAFGEKKRFFFGLPCLFCLTMAIATFFMKPSFTAKTVILPPQLQSQSTAGAILDQLGPLAGATMSTLGIKNSTDMYAALFQTNFVRDRLIERFKLLERYHATKISTARFALSKKVKISTEKISGLITIEVTEDDPEFAAELANAHLEALQSLMGRLAVSDAQQRRRFFEQQIEKISGKPFRDIRVQEAILSSMIRQYEIARIDEAKEGVMMQQVDPATPPDTRSKPNKGTLVSIAGILGLFCSAATIILQIIFKQALKNPEEASRWERLKKSWRPAVF